MTSTTTSHLWNTNKSPFWFLIHIKTGARAASFGFHWTADKYYLIPEGFKLCNCKVCLISAEGWGNNIHPTMFLWPKTLRQIKCTDISSKPVFPNALTRSHHSFGNIFNCLLYSLNGHLMFYVILVSLFLTQPISPCTLDTLSLENHL